MIMITILFLLISNAVVSRRDISILFKCLKFSLKIELNLKLKKFTFSDLKFSSMK